MNTTHRVVCQNVIRLSAAQATKMFPNVKGIIESADLHSGFAILHMGPNAYAVICTAQFVACCPDYTSAKKAGEKAANVAMGIKTYQIQVKQVNGGVYPGGFTVVSTESKREILERYHTEKRFILAKNEFFIATEVK